MSTTVLSAELEENVYAAITEGMCEAQEKGSTLNK